eukprot:Opistho-2@85343
MSHNFAATTATAKSGSPTAHTASITAVRNSEECECSYAPAPLRRYLYIETHDGTSADADDEVVGVCLCVGVGEGMGASPVTNRSSAYTPSDCGARFLNFGPISATCNMVTQFHQIFPDPFGSHVLC